MYIYKHTHINIRIQCIHTHIYPEPYMISIRVAYLKQNGVSVIYCKNYIHTLTHSWTICPLRGIGTQLHSLLNSTLDGKNAGTDYKGVRVGPRDSPGVLEKKKLSFRSVPARWHQLLDGKDSETCNTTILSIPDCHKTSVRELARYSQLLQTTLATAVHTVTSANAQDTGPMRLGVTSVRKESIKHSNNTALCFSS